MLIGYRKYKVRLRFYHIDQKCRIKVVVYIYVVVPDVAVTAFITAMYICGAVIYVVQWVGLGGSCLILYHTRRIRHEQDSI